jgi:hypothetical protein
LIGDPPITTVILPIAKLTGVIVLLVIGGILLVIGVPPINK